MKIKKAFAGFLSVTFLSLIPATTFAAVPVNFDITQKMAQNSEITPISGDLDKEEQSHFKSFTGVVKEINKRDIEGEKNIILVEVENESIANIVISEDTYIIDDAKIEVGLVITGFYRTNKPMIMIYPPQYNAEVLIVENEESLNIKVDKFNDGLVSVDNFLKLNISDETEIISQDGNKFEGELANRELIVFYGASTKSIPAQTTPSKIIVLDEKNTGIEQEKVETEEVDKPEESIFSLWDFSTMNIVVSNKKINAPAAYLNKDNTVMVPLRAIAEALGFEVKWEEATQSILVGEETSLKTGMDNFNLGTAPELTDGTTYVPLNFFRDVMEMNNAYVFEGQIVIDNEEKME